MRRRAWLFVLVASLGPVSAGRAQSGYQLWLGYHPSRNRQRMREYGAALLPVAVEGRSPTFDVVRKELVGLQSLTAIDFVMSAATRGDERLVIGTRESSPTIRSLVPAKELAALGPEGFVIRQPLVEGTRVTVVAANTDIGALYGTFALLRELQMDQPADSLALA